MTSFSLTPGFSRSAASSRLRVYVLGESLVQLGHTVHVGPPIRGADVHLFQKQKTLNEFLMTPGKCKIYDFVDETQKTPLQQIHGRAAFVSTATDGLKKWYKGFPRHSDCHVIPDPIDYFLRPLPLVKHGEKKIAFFGNSKTYKHFRATHEAIASQTDWEVHVIMDEGGRTKHHSNHTLFHQWRLDNFVETIRECSVSILDHGDQETKSDNKLSVSVCAGVPMIVSRSPYCTKRLEDIGCSQWRADTPDEVVALLKKMEDQEFRFRGLQEAQARVWKSRSPIVVAEGFLKILEEYL